MVPLIDRHARRKGEPRAVRRFALERLDEILRAERVQDVVVEQKLEIDAVRDLAEMPDVVAAEGTGRRIADVTDKSAIVAADRLDGVGRAVVGDDDLLLPPRLGDGARQAFPEIRRLVRRDEDGDEFGPRDRQGMRRQALAGARRDRRLAPARARFEPPPSLCAARRQELLVVSKIIGLLERHRGQHEADPA